MYEKRPESYLLLWNLYYYELQDYEKAYDISENAFVKAVSAIELSQYKIALFLIYAKTMFKLKSYNTLFDLLQHEYEKNSPYPIFLFYYGKFGVKSK